jgi:hypothetical protein
MTNEEALAVVLKLLERDVHVRMVGLKDPDRTEWCATSDEIETFKKDVRDVLGAGGR